VLSAGGRVQCSLLAAAAAGVAVASVHHGSSPSSSDPSPSRIEDDYDIGEMLGNGHFATVHRGKSRLTGKEVAIKVVPKSKQTAESIRHEAAVLKRVSHHKRIASLEAVYETDDTFYIVMEYVSGGEVLDNLIEHGAMSEREAATLISELAGAVALLHAQGLAHADIKPENLLLTHDGHVKLVDFGLSCQFVGGERVDPNKPGADGLATGTAAYWAPEVFGSNRGPGLPNDVWSLGVITYLLLCAAHPFDDRGKADDVTLVENIIEKAPDFEGWPASEEAQQFVSMLLRKRIDERPTIEQLLQHPWIVRGGSDEEFDGSEIWQRDEKLRQFRQQTARLRAACFSVLVQQQAERSHSLRGLRKNSSERRRDDAEAGQRTLRRYDSMRGPMLETGMLRRAFNVFDRDGKGYVSTADLRRVLDGFGLGAQEGWINDGALRRVDSSDSSVFDDGAPGGGGGDDGGRRITYGSFVRMMSHTVKRVYDAGELVFVEGDPVSDFYCLLSGEVEIVKRTGFFSEEVLNTLRPGECFGENALLEGSRKRSVSIRCATPAEILTLSKEDFEAAFGSAQPETGFMRRRQTTEKTDKDDEELRKRIISFIRMVSYQQKRTLSMGEAVYSCGDTVDKFHILASGKLGVRGPAPTPLGTMQEAPETSGAHQPSPPPLQHRPVPPSSSSAEVKYGEILVGQGFGESALLSGKPKHSKTVTCEAKKCEVVEILGSDFLRLVERSRAVRRNFERLDLKRQKRNERVLQTETQGQARYRGSG
jgi:calcium/calmodulin-dependent protein kinase I